MAQLFTALSGRAYEDASGNPYPGAKAYFYVTGTTTAQDTYTSASLAVANANPVVADSSTGIWGDIYLAAKRYKVVIKDSSDNTLRTWDPVDATSQLIAAASAPSPTYPFLRYHNTTDGHVYRRNAADNAWIDEGAVDSLLNAASVTEQITGTETGKSSTPDSVAAIWQRGSDITPSGGTVSLPSTGGRVFNIAAGNFSAISSSTGGREVVFEFAGASVITHNASSLDLPGNANITAAAGDRAAFVNLAASDATGANWRCLWGVRDDGSFWGTVPATQAHMEAATNATFPVTPSVVNYHPGVAKCWGSFNFAAGTNASHNITSVADTATGRATVTIATDFSSANWVAVMTNSVSTRGGGDWTSKAAGTIELRAYDMAGTLADGDSIDFVGFGDQA